MSHIETFDVLNPGFVADPYPFYEYLHRSNCIFQDNQTSAYFIGKYDDVKTVLTTPVFTTAPLSVRAQPVMGDRVLAQMEGQEHLHKRKAVLHGLSGKYFKEKYSVLISRVTQKLLQPYLEKGEIDLVLDFGKDYAVLVTLGILGLPSENYQQIAEWHVGVANFITQLNQNELEKMHSLECSRSLRAFLAPIVEERRLSPGSDLISLLCLCDEENAMSTKEIVALCLNILLAATEPADKTLAMLFKCLLDDPELFDVVNRDRKLMRRAIEETLRLHSPVQLIPRQASTDIELSGVLIKKGALVFNMIGAANRDPNIFPEPSKFKLNRKVDQSKVPIKKHHLAFGAGLHICLGAEFSIRQIEITANILMDLLLDMRIPNDFSYVERGLYTRGPESLKLLFNRAPHQGDMYRFSLEVDVGAI
ncbi:cytochrome P450, cyclodipeptide synthase-associated [Marinomonas mediterranea]|jgi:Cytochrome P450|uniref:Cytochrome P450 n=1 Tax=Marinomonas mediterranea (strain ATCC 700492 / JCM 21426 / NBRC 103028 / MMB-1) TaxID=717774 RepID=F2JX61_MARM1|nr:cytochrome P450, cyclodipeptide synthase-associated [Marinomonas mediterranea]ADZ89580.1 cytochrome P450 [Marinomonas mediterranea MMB-1]WCN07673.1 cytochrome P450, cyclodipeptide synthase-associated [Marinomonas mediterranea]WCN11774.1 cytochrome P450, cyclodipeptide synthase-associated [Marinomonas mediterranea]WCN15822.1 cytochrome P450, cyclodipeptide synthase-associated [Marinomonas mediterranea MMB-1]